MSRCEKESAREPEIGRARARASARLNKDHRALAEDREAEGEYESKCESESESESESGNARVKKDRHITGPLPFGAQQMKLALSQSEQECLPRMGCTWLWPHPRTS